MVHLLPFFSVIPRENGRDSGAGRRWDFGRAGQRGLLASNQARGSSEILLSTRRFTARPISYVFHHFVISPKKSRHKAGLEVIFAQGYSFHLRLELRIDLGVSRGKGFADSNKPPGGRIVNIKYWNKIFGSTRGLIHVGSDATVRG